MAWHFSIQATANNTARDQVRAWMLEMGATAGNIQYHMLRGALVVNNINATLHGNPLQIQQLLLKGNPASITSEAPLLSQVTISQASFDAYTLSQSWHNPTLDLPPSISNILYHAKHISLQTSSIQHAAHLPEIFIQNINISGKSDGRQLTASGYIGSSADSWTIQSLLPTDNSKQTGHLTYQYKKTNNQVNWSGAWKSNNLHVKTQHTYPESTASIKVSLTQRKQQWVSSFDAIAWPIALPTMSTNITGKGTVTGQPENWALKSTQLAWDNSSIEEREVLVSHMLTRNLYIDTNKKHIQAEQIQLDKASFTLNIDNEAFRHSGWAVDIKNISIQDLQTKLIYQDQPIKLPPLRGTARIKNSGVQYKLSNLANEKQQLSIQSTETKRIKVRTRNTPLIQLRNLLPNPIQQKALSLNGNVSLNLIVEPSRQWAVSGDINITDTELNFDNQTFKASNLHLGIQQADTSGIHQASLTADDWFMQFPLTPKHAWSEESYLDEWAAIPWSFQSVIFNNGTIALGQEDQVWLSHTQLELAQWQSNKNATLQLSGKFGMSPIQMNMSLKPNSDQVMQWQSLKLDTKNANLFALSDWLKLSELPTIDKGHLSLSLSAEQVDGYTQASAKIGLNQFSITPTQVSSELPSQETSYITPLMANLLSSHNKVNLNFTFEGQSNWSQIGATAFIDELQKKLTQPKVRSTQHMAQFKHLGSLHIHENRSLSHNERTRLRKMIKQAIKKRGWHIELTPDLGTSELDTQLRQQIYRTQTLVKSFIGERGIKPKNIYLIQAQDKHQSTSSTAAIHINLVN